MPSWVKNQEGTGQMHNQFGFGVRACVQHTQAKATNRRKQPILYYLESPLLYAWFLPRSDEGWEVSMDGNTCTLDALLK